VLRLPQALPVVGAAVVPTWEDEDGCCHETVVVGLKRFNAFDHFVRKVHKGVATFG
jgi:hypothetical protein